MEWRVIKRVGGARPTAVVQLCDAKTILVIQIYGMKGESPFNLVHVDAYSHSQTFRDSCR